MKLEEEIKQKFPFTNNEYVNEYVEIAENFAIGFAEWFWRNSNNYPRQFTTKQLLEIYKKTL